MPVHVTKTTHDQKWSRGRPPQPKRAYRRPVFGYCSADAIIVFMMLLSRNLPESYLDTTTRRGRKARQRAIIVA
jgi:hypothetical protein